MPRNGIFISYRREDSAGHAGRLYDRLSEHFGEERIFMDLGMEPGVDFVEQIEHALETCAVLLVLIGPEWLTADDEEGRRRLDDPGDFVRMEVATALGREIRVVPLLVHGARMPDPHDLPPDLSRLARRNALELSDARWRYDVGRLVDVLERVLAEREAADGAPAGVPEPDRPGVGARVDSGDAPAAGAGGPRGVRRADRARSRPRRPRPGGPRRTPYLAGAAGIAAIAIVAALALGGAFDGGAQGGEDQPPQGIPAVISLGGDSGPDGIAVDGDSVWVAESGSGSVARIDARTGRLDPERVEVGENPDSVAVSDGEVWVTATGDDRAVAFPAGGGDVAAISVGSSPEGVALDADNVWIANSRGASVTRLALPQLERDDIEVAVGPQDVTVGAPGIAWVSSARAGTVTRISVRPGDEPIEEIRVGGRPRGIAKGADGRIWVADSERGRVIRIGPDSGGSRSRRAVKVGSAPVGLAISDGIVWVANSGDDTVSAIDEETMEPLGEPLRAGRRPIGVAARDGVAWVTSYGDGTVRRIAAPSR